jgi:hypothetical protein
MAQAQPQLQPLEVAGAEVHAAPAPEDAVPETNKQFTKAEAEELLKGSTGAHIAGYISFAVSIGTLAVNLHLMDNDDAVSEVSEGGTDCFGDLGTRQKLYVACVHRQSCSR